MVEAVVVMVVMVVMVAGVLVCIDGYIDRWLVFNVVTVNLTNL